MTKLMYAFAVALSACGSMDEVVDIEEVVEATSGREQEGHAVPAQ